MSEAGSLDEAFFRKYRTLLDAEDNAFDELEHAFEEGDRARFDQELTTWRTELERRNAFLDRNGFAAVAAP